MKQILENWLGVATPNPPTFRLSLEDQHLKFEVAVPTYSPDFDPALQRQQFHAGLWQRDVAELFISDSISGRYQEFNLAPTGAWWSAVFNAPRVQEQPQPTLQSPEIKCVLDELGWRGEMRIAYSSLICNPKSAITNANVTFVRLENGSQQLYSYCKLPGKTPDFHQPSFYLNLANLVS